MRYHPLLLLPVIIILSACKKEPPRPYYPMDETFRSYFAPGRKGSEYVYIDTVHNEYDTVRCMGKEKNLGVYELGYDSENYELYYQCSLTYKFIISLETFMGYDSAGGDQLKCAFSMSPLFLRNLYTEYIWGKGFVYDTFGSVTHLDSVSLGGKEYKDILDIKGGMEDYWRIMVARNIGIIYMDAKGPGFTGPYGLHEFHLQSYMLKPF